MGGGPDASHAVIVIPISSFKVQSGDPALAKRASRVVEIRGGRIVSDHANEHAA
ncbi:MAG: hypothetical protein M3Q69_04245 [Acidobacteriota bacterium]|nr:hypothetical protein [Acidobacteriota bacterium]